MDIEKILEDFAVPERFPREAIAEVTANREAVLPRFLKELEDFAAGVEEPEVPTPVFCIFHLLGSWRETRAYRAMARALMVDEERLEMALSDAVTETAHRVMLNVFDGDPQPIHDIIESETANPWVRSRMMELLALLARDGRLPREQVVAYLRDAPDRLEPKDTHDVWVGWQGAIALLGVTELVDRVHQAFEEQWIDPFVMGVEDFDEDMRLIQADPNDERVMKPSEFAPFGDFEEELGDWNWDWGAIDLEPEVERPGGGGLADLFARIMDEQRPHEPVVNPYRDVGRNDPCPCGSGKKFKKCHGA